MAGCRIQAKKVESDAKISKSALSQYPKWNKNDGVYCNCTKGTLLCYGRFVYHKVATVTKFKVGNN